MTWKELAEKIEALTPRQQKMEISIDVLDIHTQEYVYYISDDFSITDTGQPALRC